MSSARNLSLSLSLLLVVAVAPVAWLACGGGGKPAEGAADETSSGEGGSSAPAESSSDTAPAASADTTPAPAATPPPPPPPPAFGDSDCGKCVDKTCAKAVTACGKAPDCQTAVDGIHSCTGASLSCITGATMPPAGKPKKLATAYGVCAKKAIAKACKASCQ